MEEKEIKTKEVKMSTVKSEQQKLSYEELNQACAELSQQLQNQNKYIQQLRQHAQQLEYALQTRRMDYLFKVVETSSAVWKFNEDFVQKCIAEIQEALTIPEEKDDTPEEK